MQGFEGSLSREMLSDLDGKRVLVKDVLTREQVQPLLAHDMAEDQIALLFAYPSRPDNDWEKVRLRLERAAAEIQTELHIQVRFAVGPLQEELVNISRSYEEARNTLEYMRWRSLDGVMAYDQIPGENRSYYYPSDLEVRLSHLAKAGEQEAVETLLNELYNVNFKEKQLSILMLRLLVNEMWGTLVKLLPQVGMDETYVLDTVKPFADDMKSYEGLERSLSSLAEVYRDICICVNEHKKSQNIGLLESIMALLQDSYSDSDLCLDSVAGRLDISKGYLSQFFKEQTGVNFSDYLEDLRMNRAKELLERSGLPVYEIALKVGYGSSNTFCRAFKRLNGVSATAYREGALKTNLNRCT
ncbi:helix-turn-helix domain-containing protein [Paenibacillus sp. CC-CFT747]|nr:helix-turn-helix domain-containing protein [Paenibacillus sp. CC-CFT747]